jgi:hypothetical protein
MVIILRTIPATVIVAWLLVLTCGPAALRGKIRAGRAES